MPDETHLPQSLSEFRRFRDRLDGLLAEAWQLYQDKMQCRAGCSACCRGDFRISLIEALEVRVALASLSDTDQAVIRNNLSRSDANRCPLLINERCGIYARRPLLCRIFGFPVTDGEQMATCELNFRDEQSQVFTAKSFNKPAITETLTLLSNLYLEEMGQLTPTGTAPPTFLIREVLQG